MEQKITIPEGFELQKVNDSEYRIVKKEAELPNSWEEFCNRYPYQAGEGRLESNAMICRVSSPSANEKRIASVDKTLLPNKEYAEAILSLCQLIQLRNCYRQGWKPNWAKGFVKFVIEFYEGKLQCEKAVNSPHIFSFKSEEIRDKFYYNFKDLIEKTKPLFM